MTSCNDVSGRAEQVGCWNVFFLPERVEQIVS